MTVAGQLFLSLFPALFVLGGGYMLKATYDGRQRAAGIEATEPTPVGDLRPDGGLTVVEGTARARADDRVDAAMLDREGVYVYTQIEERSAREIGENAGPAWETVYTESDGVPFAINDDTGEVPIALPDQGTTTLDSEVFEAESGEKPPKPVRRWLEGTDVDVDEEIDPHRAYKQGVIEDGETVYAKGEPAVDADGQLVFTGDARPDEFRLTDLSRDELAAEEATSRGGYAIGAVLLAIGLLPLAFIWLG